MIATLSSEAARAMASAFALYFDLVNLAEEQHRVATLRQRERALPAPVGESISAALATLRGQGVTPEQMAGLLASSRSRSCSPRTRPRPGAGRSCRSCSGSPTCCGPWRRRPAAREARAAEAALHAEIAALWLTDALAPTARR